MRVKRKRRKEHKWEQRTERIQRCAYCFTDRRQGVRVNYYRPREDSEWFSSARDPWCYDKRQKLETEEPRA